MVFRKKRKVENLLQNILCSRSTHTVINRLRREKLSVLLLSPICIGAAYRVPAGQRVCHPTSNFPNPLIAEWISATSCCLQPDSAGMSFQSHLLAPQLFAEYRFTERQFKEHISRYDSTQNWHFTEWTLHRIDIPQKPDCQVYMAL